MEAIIRVLAADSSAVEATTPTAVARRYAAKTVERILIDQFRRRGREVVSDAGEFPEQLVENQETQPDPKLLKQAEALLADLESRDQSLLESYFAGAEFFRSEVERQQLKQGTARVRVHRALTRLRERAGRPHRKHRR